uniref:Uncharacterized protein n=1 Tax=Nephromyces sp. ex Molgula occidentalis TaxID=2544991 RepID=A0A5C1H7R1_9APIC|nr:hypothetical protein [Nephromyces sp. ex Molgula occidentalis]
MIAFYKNKKNSKSKIIKLFKVKFLSNINTIGLYDSKKKFLYYKPKYISSSLKLGHKISKNLIKVLLKDLK